MKMVWRWIQWGIEVLLLLGRWLQHQRQQTQYRWVNWKAGYELRRQMRYRRAGLNDSVDRLAQLRTAEDHQRPTDSGHE